MNLLAIVTIPISTGSATPAPEQAVFVDNTGAVLVDLDGNILVPLPD